MKVKKLLAFVLALAMVFALAVPAFAAMPEVAEPNGGTYCPNCHKEYHSYGNYYEWRKQTGSITVGACPHSSATHTHTYYTRYLGPCTCISNAVQVIESIYCPYYGYM